MKKSLILVLSLFMTLSCFAASKNLVQKDTISASIKNINIQLLSEELVIKEIYGDEIAIEIYSNNKRYIPNIENDNDTLSITSKTKAFRFGEYCTVEICIPQDKKFNNITIDQASGSAEIEKLYADNISITSSSGSLKADNLTTDYSLKVRKSSGSTKIEKVASDDFKVTASSGSIKIGSLNTINSEFNTTSGSIKVEKLDTESFDVETSSGSISISSIAADYFTARSTSGSMQLELENAPVATSKITSTSGSVKLYLLSKDGFNLKYASTSGSLNDGINGNRASPHGTYESTFFDGGADLIIKTTSGSLSIDD